jgi:fatty-acyl-CoA synthase
VRHWARLAPRREALTDRRLGTRWSYAHLDAAADRWAAVLRSSGVGRGQRVATMLGNRQEHVALFFACGRVGAMLVPLNWRLAAAELASVLADSQPTLIVGEQRYRAVTEGALRIADASVGATVRAPWIDVDAEAPALLARATAEGNLSDVSVEPDDPWLVLYTSGSTGRPKGAMIPHRQIYYNAVATTTSWELGAHDVAPVTTPFFHTGGWNVFATPLWFRGGRVALLDRFDPAELLDTIAEEQCTVALTVPTQLVMLLESEAWARRRETPRFRAFWSGGAPCPPAVISKLRADGARLREGYGLTECGPNCFAISQKEADARMNCVGRPIAHLEMRVMAEHGRDAEPDEPGELWLRGPQLFAGYLNAPERTAEVMTDDGWLRTGDLARRDAGGAYTICGRKKEMFISGGENVFPGEVEAAIAECPGVSEVVVVGVPDERWGEVGRAFVVGRPGTTLAEADVLRHSRGRLAGYKVPKSVIVLSELPRLGSGKPDRRALASYSVS